MQQADELRQPRHALVRLHALEALARHLAESRAFIRAQLAATAADGSGVLVHCLEGKNRSATIAVAYLVAEERVPLLQAVGALWAQRPIVLDNRSFVEQLVDLADREGLLY